MKEHCAGTHLNAFTRKYNAHKLVYYGVFSQIEEAIVEEKHIKAGSRRKKIALINSMNPDWVDLWEERLSAAAKLKPGGQQTQTK